MDQTQSSGCREFVDYVARTLARSPDDVEVSESEVGNTTVYRLKLAQEDVGRIIGREGRTVRAVRSLLRAAAVRQGTHVALEID